MHGYTYSITLSHHGIPGQKWGERNGPPYPLTGGAYTETEKKELYKKRRSKNSIYNKKHFDEVLKKKGTTLSTLSYDPNRTKDTDMFFATTNKLDSYQYMALFNKAVPKTIYDKNGKSIGTGNCFKYQINNTLKKDIKVASEDSGAEVFKTLYAKDQDFYNFVTDKKRMQSLYPENKYLFKGYKESMQVLDKIRSDSSYTPTGDDIQKAYRLFNYVIPNDGGGNQKVAKDVMNQRAKFFSECKKQGYGAVLDVNDAIYGGFKARLPVIIFDTDAIITKDIRETKLSDKRVAAAVLATRKMNNFVNPVMKV